MMMMMTMTDNSICSDGAGHTRAGKKMGVGHIGVGEVAPLRGRPSEKGGKVRAKKSRRNNQSVGMRGGGGGGGGGGRGGGGGGGGEKKRKRRRKGSLRMMGDQPPGLVTRPYGNDVVGHNDQVNSSSPLVSHLFCFNLCCLKQYYHYHWTSFSFPCFTSSLLNFIIIIIFLLFLV